MVLRTPISIDAVTKSKVIITKATLDQSPKVRATAPGSGALVGFTPVQQFDPARVGRTAYFVKPVGGDDYAETSQDQAEYVFYFQGPYRMDGNVLSCKWGDYQGTMTTSVQLDGFGAHGVHYSQPAFDFPPEASGDLLFTAGDGFAYGYSEVPSFHATKTFRTSYFESTRAATGSLEFSLKTASNEPITGLRQAHLVLSLNGSQVEDKAYELNETASGSYRVVHPFVQNLPAANEFSYVLYVPTLAASASWSQ